MTDDAQRQAFEWYEDYQVEMECDPQEDFDWYIAGALEKYAAATLAQAVTERDERIEAKDYALQFAEGAIDDAIHREDGLDGLTGEKVLSVCREARESGTFDQEPFDRARLPSVLIARQAEEIARLRELVRRFIALDEHDQDDEGFLVPEYFSLHKEARKALRAPGGKTQ